MANCEEVSFISALCRIVVEPDPTWAPGQRFLAQLFLVERGAVRPLVTRTGSRIEIAADSQALAVNTAIGYLERTFGTFSQMMHKCPDAPAAFPLGAPYVVDTMADAAV
jgi:hypothetical protein